MFGGAAAAALVLVLILIAINQDRTGEHADATVFMPDPIPADIPRDGRVLGSPDAPVRIIEYSDFQCPACGQFATNIKPLMIQEYVATGLVSLEARDLTGLGSESWDAAVGAACALEQDRYWDFHDTLFRNQIGNDNGAFASQRLIRMAEQLEMDVEAFEECLDSDRNDDAIEAMTSMATQDSIRATPTLLIDGSRLEGVPNYAALQQQIESALRNAGS